MQNTLHNLFKAEELDERKVQIVPPGFHVIFLPFADDFRKLKLDEQLPRGALLYILLYNCNSDISTDCVNGCFYIF